MRSNSFVTQRVVFALKNYLDGQLRDSRTYADTRLDVAEGCLFVKVNGNTVMTVFKESDDQVVSVVVTDGFYYDADGNPTKTTRERLNGLLDALGDEQIIPQGVRVYIDGEYGVCYLKHEKSRIPIGKHYNKFVQLVPSKTEFICKTQEQLAAEQEA